MRPQVQSAPARTGTTRVLLAALALATLGLSAATRAEDAGAVAAVDAPADPPAPEAAAARAGRHSPAARRTIAQGIDDSVHRLTVALDLDADQQQALRQILVDQRRRILKLRSPDAAAAPDRTATMLAIYDQTRARIRALLNDEQKKKYAIDVPRADLAPAQADMTKWMELQEAKRRQDQADGGAK